MINFWCEFTKIEQKIEEKKCYKIKMNDKINNSKKNCTLD